MATLNLLVGCMAPPPLFLRAPLLLFLLHFWLFVAILHNSLTFSFVLCSLACLASFQLTSRLFWDYINSSSFEMACFSLIFGGILAASLLHCQLYLLLFLSECPSIFIPLARFSCPAIGMFNKLWLLITIGLLSAEIVNFWTACACL